MLLDSSASVRWDLGVVRNALAPLATRGPVVSTAPGEVAPPRSPAPIRTLAPILPVPLVGTTSPHKNNSLHRDDGGDGEGEEAEAARATRRPRGTRARGRGGTRRSRRRRRRRQSQRCRRRSRTRRSTVRCTPSSSARRRPRSASSPASTNRPPSAPPNSASSRRRGRCRGRSRTLGRLTLCWPDDHEIKILNPCHKGKRLLISGIDSTLFDHRSAADNPDELMRPYLHKLLFAAHSEYDIMIWSATGMKWVELKMGQLGVLSNPNYKIIVLLGRFAMMTVQSKRQTEKKTFDCKPLGVIWAQFFEYYNEKENNPV